MIENIGVRTDQTSEYALDITVRLQEFIIVQTSGDSASNLPIGSNANQANPASTGTTINGGTVTPIEVPNAPTFVQYMKLFGG